MGFDTLVVNGRVVTATDTYSSDIAISAGKIEAIGKDLSRENTKKIIDAKGKYVLPGGIDVHTHLDMNLPKPPLCGCFTATLDIRM